ncbi:MAG: DUF429 domain-containing protein [Thermoplasmata archaeon]|nr:DUF429 domain-containing protein [Thermoplasmata archaeon]
MGEDLVAATQVLRSDGEILEWAESAPGAPVAIDAPLSLPRGRASLEVRGPPHFRACDLELRARGIPFFPLTLGPMRMLTARGIALRKSLEREAHPVIESYPGGVQDLLGWPRKGRGIERLRRAMRRDGFSGSVVAVSITHDELDSVACALAALRWAEGRAIVLGDPDEGQIALVGPSAEIQRRVRSRGRRAMPSAPGLPRPRRPT